MNRLFRRDSGEALFLARQLEYIMPEVYRKKYAQHKARIHFPVSFEGGKGAKTITHRMVDRRNRAAIGLGFPRVSLAQREYSTNVIPLTASYSYDVMQVRRAMKADYPLQVESAFAAKEIISELENELAYLGDAEANVNGAFTSREVAIQLAQFPISEASTSDQIISVVNRAINSAPILSLGTEMIDTVLMSIEKYTLIATRPRTNEGGGSSDTILEYLQKAHPTVTFDWCNQCSGAGIGGGDVMFCYARNNGNVLLIVPSDFEQLPQVETEKGETVVLCIEEFGGIKYIYASAILVEGV